MVLAPMIYQIYPQYFTDLDKARLCGFGSGQHGSKGQGSVCHGGKRTDLQRKK